MFSVAIIGPDGAGKTTITGRLRQLSSLPLKCLYMGINVQVSNFALPTSRLVERLKLYPRRKSAAHQWGLALSRRKGMRFLWPRVWAAASLANRLAEEWYRQLLSWYFQICGYIVVYDRHFLFDFTLDGIETETPPLANRLHRWLLTRFYPVPRLTIYLDAPGDVLFARKGEKTVDELERRRQAFLQLGKSTPNFVRIEATQPIDTVYAEVVRQIRKEYENQRRERRGLFSKGLVAYFDAPVEPMPPCPEEQSANPSSSGGASLAPASPRHERSDECRL